jgi:hypothetical protein
MTTHVHNMEGYYRLRVQFSYHKDFRDLTEILTGSSVYVCPEDVLVVVDSVGPRPTGAATCA